VFVLCVSLESGARHPSLNSKDVSSHKTHRSIERKVFRHATEQRCMALIL